MNKSVVIGSWFMVHSKWLMVHCSLLIVFLLPTIYYLPSTTYAQEASSAGEVKGEKIASESSTLSEKLNTLLSESASKAAEMVKDINKKLQNKAVFGKITSFSEDRIILQTSKATKNISINEFTAYQNGYKTSTSKKLSFKNLEKED